MVPICTLLGDYQQETIISLLLSVYMRQTSPMISNALLKVFLFNIFFFQCQDGVCDCYLPDHGHNETLNRSQLREIDSQLNVALSYQVSVTTVHLLNIYFVPEECPIYAEQNVSLVSLGLHPLQLRANSMEISSTASYLHSD